MDFAPCFSSFIASRHEVCPLCFSDPPGPQARESARQLRLRAQNMRLWFEPWLRLGFRRGCDVDDRIRRNALVPCARDYAGSQVSLFSSHMSRRGSLTFSVGAMARQVCNESNTPVRPSLSICPSRRLVNRLHTRGTSSRASSVQGQGVSATTRADYFFALILSFYV